MKLGNGKIGMKDKLIDFEKNLKTEKLIDEDETLLHYTIITDRRAICLGLLDKKQLKTIFDAVIKTIKK